MKLLNFLIIKITICLILGILIGYYFCPSSRLLFQVFSLLLILFCFQFFYTLNKSIQKPFFGLLTYILFLLIGCISTHIQTHSNQKNYYNKYAVADKPNLINIQLYKKLKPSKYHQRYLGKIIYLNRKKATGTILVNIADSLEAGIDSCFLSYTALTQFSQTKNPHQFNFKAYMAKKNIRHQLFLSAHNSKNYLSKPTIYGYTNNIRNRINKHLQPHIKNPNNLSIINALLLGQRQDINEDVYQNFTQAGAIHILAISGLHIGIIMLLLNWLLKPLQKLPKLKKCIPFIIITLLWFYAFIAGLSASVVRAVTMFSLLSIAIHFKRRTNTYNTLCISAFILLLCNPNYLFDVGFQLSYTAVFAIISIKPLFDKIWKPKNLVLKKLYDIFSVSLAAQIGIVPLSLYYFHQFPGLFMLSNLIIIPILGILLVFGFVIIITAYFNILNQLVPFYEYLIDLLQEFVAYIAQKEQFIFEQISFNSLNLISSYILIISFVILWNRFSVKKLALVLTSIIIFQSALLFNKYKHQKKNELIVFNQYKNTLIGMRNGQSLNYASSSENTRNNINNYIIGEFITEHKKDSIKNIYLVNQKKILLIDSKGIYKTSYKPNIVILTQSPKINLDRLINSLKPNLVIADNNNYKSYVTRWRSTCKKQKIPFHSTNEKGWVVIR
ncbi:ComEC/Rec2 family competence protein [Pseudofulvibacter geojedonensis]|uniref:ComEC/Rec2 family competence protein n=1 Tax=Pseudofulvibacter geojedonensis TaxID=1123758 RepID=A0ABW3I3Z3_9FLAO